MSASTATVSLPKLSYGLDEAAVATGVSRAFLYEQMKAGRLKSIKIGKRRLLREEDLRAFLASMAAD